MAIKFSETEKSYKCPNCYNVVKTETLSDIMMVIYVLLFIPIGLIALIVKFIKSKTMKTTTMGEEVITCPYCKKEVVITQVGTRLYYSSDELFKMLQPTLETFKQNLNISIERFEDEEAPDDTLFIEFRNKNNGNKHLMAFMFVDKLYIIDEEQNMEEFTMEKLTKEICSYYLT